MAHNRKPLDVTAASNGSVMEFVASAARILNTRVSRQHYSTCTLSRAAQKRNQDISFFLGWGLFFRFCPQSKSGRRRGAR